MLNTRYSRARRFLSVPGGWLEGFGDQIGLYGKAYGWTYRALLRYKKEIVRQLTAVSFGRGALALVGGTAVIIAVLTGLAGVEVSLEGYSQLANIGVEALTGFVSAYINTRIAAPLIASIARISPITCSFSRASSPTVRPPSSRARRIARGAFAVPYCQIMFIKL